jgi:toxin YoeB
MGKYIVTLNPKATEDIKFYQKAGNKIAIAKINRILEELEIHPETGIGRPEKKKYNYSGYWSREIDKKNRMLYQIKENIVTVEVVSAIGHYDDK